MRFFIVESVYVLGVCAIMPTEPDQVKYKAKILLRCATYYIKWTLNFLELWFLYPDDT